MEKPLPFTHQFVVHFLDGHGLPPSLRARASIHSSEASWTVNFGDPPVIKHGWLANGPFISNCAIKTFSRRGFPLPMFDYQRVVFETISCSHVIFWANGGFISNEPTINDRLSRAPWNCTIQETCTVHVKSAQFSIATSSSTCYCQRRACDSAIALFAFPRDPSTCLGSVTGESFMMIEGPRGL